MEQKLTAEAPVSLPWTTSQLQRPIFSPGRTPFLAQNAGQKPAFDAVTKVRNERLKPLNGNVRSTKSIR